MKFISSLKQALTLSFILAAALPVILFALVTTKYVRDYLLEDVAKDNVFLAGELREQTRDFLWQPVALLKHVSSVLDSDNMESRVEIDSYLEKEVRTTDFFESIYILDKQGKVVNLGVNKKLEQQKQDYYSIDLSGHALYQGGRPAGEIFWSDTFVSVVTGEPSITLAMRLPDGTLVGNLSLNRLDSIVKRFSYADGIAFAIVDRKGSLIAHSNTEMAQQRVNMLFHPEVFQALNENTETGFHIHEDESLLESVLKIQETGWVVWVGRSKSTILAPVDRVLNFMLGVLGLSIIIGMALSLVSSRKLMRPIAGLVDNLARLTAGNYQIGAAQKSYSEIEELTTAFSRMSLAVVEREASILEREERFRNLVNSIEGIVWEYDVAAEAYTFVSAHCEELLGCPYQQWLESADVWKRFVHPDDRQWVVDYFKGLSEGNLSPQFEYRMIDTANRTIWVRNMVNVVYESKRPVKLYGVILDINDRKNSEIALRESELRFRSLVEQAADGIFIHDQSGNFVEVNDQGCRSLGYSREEMLGMTVQDIDASHDSLQFSSLWNTVLHGKSLTMEAEYQRKDGSLFPVEVRLGSFTFQDMPLYLALVRDISERRRADAALRASEERYRSVVNAMSEGVMLFDDVGNLLASNPAAESILRQDHSALAKLSLSRDWRAVHDDGSVFMPDDYPIRQTQRTGLSFKNIVMGLKLSDSEKVDIWIQINTQPVLSQGHTRPTGVVATFSDVTERRTILHALQESEEQVRLLLDSTADGIYSADTDGICTLCNPAALKLLGYDSVDQLLGKNIHELIHHSRVDGSPIAGKDCLIYQAVQKREHVQSDEEVFWRADGTWFYVAYSGHPIIKDDQLIGSVVTFQDITERKQLQQQSFRTAQLASLGELAAGVAHEINNPINGVINYAQILLNRLNKSGLETDLADRIIKEGERIATIVRDLLFFAREGGPEMNLSNISDVLGEALSLTESQIRKEGILLQLDIAADLPVVSTRAQQIQQLFLNLLSNARHALHEKYPASDDQKIIEISVHPISKNNKIFVQTVIKDYGAGISPGILEKVMNPFVTTKPAGVGTGLGLSISHEIVNNHHGDIRITSQEGEWTQVVVELPAAEKGQK